MLIKYCKTILYHFINPESLLAKALKGILNRLKVRINPIEWQLKQAIDSYSSWIRIKTMSSKTSMDLLSKMPMQRAEMAGLR